MGTVYSIAIRIKTHKGWLYIGSFGTGAGTELACSVFDNLKSDITAAKEPIIQIDLIKKEANVPVPLKTLSCTLDQYAENCRIIARDIFKFSMLEK